MLQAIIIKVLTIFLNLILLIGANTLIGQPIYKSVHNFTTKDGLASNVTYCIYQDRVGYLWVGTNIGISRFNGYEFVNYGLHEGLTDREISHIVQDTNDVIWFCSIWGSVYYLDNNVIQKYKFQRKLDSIRKLGNYITGIDIISTPFKKDVELYIGIQGHGLVHIDKLGQIERISAGEHCYSVIYYENKDRKFAVTQSCWDKFIQCNSCPQPVNIYRYVNNCFEFIVSNNLVAHDVKFVQTISNKLVFGFSKFTLIIDQLTKENIVIDELKDLSGIQLLTYNNYIISSSLSSGLRYGNIFNLKLVSNSKDYSIQGKVSSTIRDNQSNFWISTLDNGIYKLQFSNELKIIDKAVKLNRKSNFKKIAYDSLYKELWYINDQEELIRYSLGTDKKYVVLRNVVHINDISSYYGNTYVATHNLIIYFKNGVKNIVSHSFFKEIYAKGFASFHNKDTLLAYNNSGVFYLVGSVLYPCKRDNFMSLNSRVFDLLESRNRLIYCIYLDSIKCYDPYFNTSMGFPDLKTNSKVFEMESNNIGELFFGTRSDGIVSLQANKLTKLNTASGLMSDEVIEIEVDNDNNLWVLSTRGFDKISFKNGRQIIENYPIAKFDGIKTPTEFKVFDNIIWFVTVDGVYQFNPEPNLNSNVKPVIEFITDLNNNSILDLNNINYANNTFKIAWCSLDFTLNGKIMYRYRLKNTDPWVETMNRTITLYNLEPSDYYFEVQSQSASNKWSDSIVVLFHISSPWWRTPQFFVIGFSMLSLMIVLGIRNRERDLKFKNKELKSINELKNKAVISQVNPHFIFNCLNSIKLLIRQAKNHEAENYLSHFAKMLRYSIRAVQNMEWSVNEEISIIQNYIELENLRVKDKISLNLLNPSLVNMEEINVPSMILQPLVENSIKHGLSHALENLIITVSIKVENNYLIIEIVDNGIGIQNESKNRVDFIEEGEHIGLKLTKNRLDYYNGSGASPVQVISPIDLERNSGTKIVLYIRLNN